jgi:hypothetical protein
MIWAGPIESQSDIGTGIYWVAYHMRLGTLIMGNYTLSKLGGSKVNFTLFKILMSVCKIISDISKF